MCSSVKPFVFKISIVFSVVFDKTNERRQRFDKSDWEFENFEVAFMTGSPNGFLGYSLYVAGS